MSYYTYIIESEASGKLYIGQTNNLENRIVRHKLGKSNYTRNKGPWRLLFAVKLETRSEAMLLEKKLKAFKNPEKVKHWIKNQQTD